MADQYTITAATTESIPQELILQASTTQTNAKPLDLPLIIYRFRREPHLHWQLVPWIKLGLPDMVRKIRMLCLVQMWGPNLQKRLATVATDGFSMASCRLGRIHEFTIELPQPQWPCGNRNLKESDWPHLEQTSAKSSRYVDTQTQKKRCSCS